jgi:hypothetical protein
MDRVDVTLAELRARLVTKSFLFDEPRIYEAGVEDALAAVEAFVRGSPAAEPIVAAEPPSRPRPDLTVPPPSTARRGGPR